MFRVILLSSLFTIVVGRMPAQTFVACQPHGGMAAVKDLFDQELRMPDRALADKVKGSTVLIFTVTAQGELKDLRIWRPLSPECDEEALRVGALVRWHPARLSGREVDAEHYLEVPFKGRDRRSVRPRCGEDTGKRTSSDITIHMVREVDQAPVPDVPGGLGGLPAYAATHMRYPEDARRRDIQGDLRMEFVVETTGSVSNMRPVRDLGGGCAEEARRLLLGMCWEPALKDGLPVRCLVQVDLTFRLPRYDR